MAEVLERDIEAGLVTEVRKHGGRAYKFVSPGNDGVPDRLVVMPGGKTIFVELKRTSGELRPQQRIQIERLMDLGQTVEVVRGPEGLIRFFLQRGWFDSVRTVRSKNWEEVVSNEVHST